MKRLYAWVVGWADSRFGTSALLVLGFAEASFFPIPPDPLLIALCLGNRKRSLYYGAALTAASVAGGIAGWYIGRELFEAYAAQAIEAIGAGGAWFGSEGSASGVDPATLPRAGETVFYPDGYFYKVQERFRDNAFLAYFGAALSPIPYKVFTIAGGVFEVSLAMLIAGSVAGRGLRFMTLSFAIHRWGDKVKPILERYFEWITLALAVLLVAGFVATHYLL